MINQKISMTGRVKIWSWSRSKGVRGQADHEGGWCEMVREVSGKEMESW